MHSDFPTTAKSARAAIPVPNVPLEKILRRSRALSNHDRLRMVVAAGALALAAVAGGTVGPKIYGGIQFWFSGGRWAVAVHSLTIMSPPTVAELRTVTKNATFRVVYPVGLPAGTHLIRIMFAPATHPTSITLNYLNARSGYFGGFTLIDSRIVNATAFPHPRNGQTLYGVASAHLTRLQIGDETVVAFGDKGPPARMHGIEAAMQSTSPAAALSANEAMLWKNSPVERGMGVWGRRRSACRRSQRRVDRSWRLAANSGAGAPESTPAGCKGYLSNKHPVLQGPPRI